MIHSLGKYIKRIPVTVIIVITILLLPATVNGSSIEVHYIDPAPLLRLMQDIFIYTLDNRYEEARNLCILALNISLPDNLYYSHKKFYILLLEIVKLLSISKDLDNMSSYRLSDLVHRLYISREDLKEASVKYINMLSSYFVDQATRYIMIKTVEGYLDTLYLKIDVEINRVIYSYIYLNQSKHLQVILIHPEKAYGGENIKISLCITSQDLEYIENISIRLTTVYGDIIVKRENIVTSMHQWIDIEIQIPRAEELYAIGINPLDIDKISINIIATAYRDNEYVYGYTSANISVIYEKPRLVFNAPGFIYVGQFINISIYSFIDTPLNISIYLDTISNTTLITNTTVFPGITNITLPIINLSTGYHRLIFVSSPKGKYISITHTIVFAVSRYKVLPVVDIDRFSIIPLGKININLYIDTPLEYRVEVYINNKKIAEYNYVNASKIFLQIDTPPTIFLWKYKIIVEIKPLNSLYESSYREGYIYVLNLPMLVIIPIILGFVLSTSSQKYLLISLKTMRTSLNKIMRKIEYEQMITSSPLSIEIKRSILVNLYRRILLIISRYVDLPKKSETLREFYLRLENRVKNINIKQLFKLFIDLYEKDLYSLYRVDVDNAKDIVKRLENIED